MLHVDEGTLHELVDNQLSPAERAAVEAHLASCGECARRFAEATAMARQTVSLLGMLDDDRATPVTVLSPSMQAAALLPTSASELRPQAARGATPRRTVFTLRRIALAASLGMVAGISYQIGTNKEASSSAKPESVALPMTASPAREAAPAVAAAPSAMVNPPAGGLSRETRGGGPNLGADSAVPDRADGMVAQAGPPSPARVMSPTASLADAAPAGQRATPIAPTENAAPANVEQRRAQLAEVATAQERSQDRAADRTSDRAQQDRASDRASEPSQQRGRAADASQASAQYVQQSSGAPSARPAPAPSVAAAPSPSTPVSVAEGAALRAEKQSARAKSRALAGYTVASTTDATATVTRVRYISAAGTPLTLLVSPIPNETKVDVDRETVSRGAEFVVTTVSGVSGVRWQVNGQRYELSGALAPDSLVKLATLLK
jgi:anti-sigma factor RsiW